jgi:cardiolipin synthase
MVLVDAWGSWELPDSFWDDLRTAGGSVRWFRPIRRGLLPFRNHRKLLLIDDRRTFLGGLNVADEYFRGRGGERPWRDNAVAIDGAEVARLRRSFNRMWTRADKPLRLQFLRKRQERHEHLVGSIGGGRVRFLESGPEDPGQPVRRAYGRMIRRAKRDIDLAMSYFFPPGRVLRALKQAVRRGVRVRLLFPEKSDVPITRWAARGLYGRLLRAGMEVWEYRPAMLHAKLAIADDTVICGSANLDIRSTWLNYELVAAVTDAGVAAKARAEFEKDLAEAVRITIDDWKRRPLIQKLKERVSHWLLARADLFVSRMDIMRARW